jgi:hypothetical protein
VKRAGDESSTVKCTHARREKGRQQGRGESTGRLEALVFIQGARTVGPFYANNLSYSGVIVRNSCSIFLTRGLESGTV